jgi:imidazoleglycerol phosphate dehydratase HisB
MTVGELTFHIRPYTYKEFTKKTLARIEQEKIFNIVNDKDMSDEEKVDRFGVSFVRLTELTVENIADVVKQIDTPNGSETDAAQIKDFILNSNKDIFEALSRGLNAMKAQLDLKVKNSKCDKCEHIFDINVTMDQADFFGARS